jgi:translation elongation factor EF-Tu-like GTPase
MPCDLRLLGTAEGGRETALEPGWRGVASFGEPAYGVEVQLTNMESLAPGEEGLGELGFLGLDELPAAVVVGAEFELREGERTVGTGQILGVTGGAL